MSHEGGPESTQQRTVAELLAMYGDGTGERAPRRRRRRPDDTTDTGAHTIIERVNSESAKIQPIREDTPPPSRTSHRQQRSGSHRQPEPPPRPAPPRSAAPPPVRQPAPQPPPQIDSDSLPPQFRQPSRPAMRPVQEPPSRTDLRRAEPPSRTDLPRAEPPRPPVQQPSQQLPKPQPRPPQQPPGVAASEPTRPVPPPQQPRGQRRPGPPPQDMPSGRFPAPPPMDADPYGADFRPTQSMSPIGNGVVAEEETQQLPRVGQPTGQHPVPFPPARANFGPSQAPPAGPEQRNGLAVPPDVRYPDDYPDLDTDEDDNQLEDFPDYPDEDDLEAEEFDDDVEDTPSPGREWLVMAGQVAISVIGGAGVWLGFNWLWGKLPQAALVAALAVIVGLVWIVRKIRRADDLQTTGLAVLVGLFVTVSPAALLLLSR